MTDALTTDDPPMEPDELELLLDGLSEELDEEAMNAFRRDVRANRQDDALAVLRRVEPSEDEARRAYQNLRYHWTGVPTAFQDVTGTDLEALTTHAYFDEQARHHLPIEVMIRVGQTLQVGYLAKRSGVLGVSTLRQVYEVQDIDQIWRQVPAPTA